MVLTLIESGFTSSLMPGALTFTCKWDANGTIIYSSALVEPDAILTVNFWNDMIRHVIRWHGTRKRKHGEIADLQDLGCAQRGEGDTTQQQEPS